jgi:cysteinyl-tRNA synthetase
VDSVLQLPDLGLHSPRPHRPRGGLRQASAGVRDAGVGRRVLTDQLLLDLRKAARERKDFETADQIRKRLEELGFEIQDSAKGSTWRRR